MDQEKDPPSHRLRGFSLFLGTFPEARHLDFHVSSRGNSIDAYTFMQDFAFDNEDLEEARSSVKIGGCHRG
jgi:hypothetical protein